jgi:glyoxylase-like metal-dependent hydrolase (beta-lactamase superfamily II)
MSGHQLATGIWRVPTSPADRDNAYLVDGDDGITLVDVGWASAPDRLLKALAQQGRGTGDVKRIVITHAHPDHVRGLAGLRREVPAEVLIHAADAGWLRRGRVPPGGRSGAAGTLLDALPLLHWTPVEPDGHLDDGAVIAGSNGLRVIHTPGHTPGHVVLFHEPTKTLLTGDAVFHRGPAPSQGPALLAHDPGARDRSLRRLPAEVTSVGFAHGAPLIGSDVEQYQTWLTQALPVATRR